MCNCHNDHTTLECPRYLKVNRPRPQKVEGPVEFLDELKAAKLSIDTIETAKRLTLKDFDKQPIAKENEYITLYDIKKNGLPFIPLNLEKDTEVTGKGRLIFNTRPLVDVEDEPENSNEVILVSDLSDGNINPKFKELKALKIEIGEQENTSNETIGAVYGDFAVHGRFTATEELASNRLTISDHVEFGSIQSSDDVVFSNYLQTYFARYPLYGGTVEPTLPNHFVTKKYVDEHGGGGGGTDPNAVHKTGHETIEGIKTFLTLPQSSLSPSLDTEFTTKKYTDSNYLKLNSTSRQSILGDQTIAVQPIFMFEVPPVCMVDPYQSNQLATKKYVDDHSGGTDPNAVHKTGNESIDGLKTFLTLPQTTLTPTQSSDFATKGYVDERVEQAYDPLAVHTHSDQNIDGLKTFLVLPRTSLTPSMDEEFATKKYVDDHSGEGIDPTAIHKISHIDQTIEGIGQLILRNKQTGFDQIKMTGSTISLTTQEVGVLRTADLTRHGLAVYGGTALDKYTFKSICDERGAQISLETEFPTRSFPYMTMGFNNGTPSIELSESPKIARVNIEDEDQLITKGLVILNSPTENQTIYGEHRLSFRHDGNNFTLIDLNGFESYDDKCAGCFNSHGLVFKDESEGKEKDLNEINIRSIKITDFNYRTLLTPGELVLSMQPPESESNGPRYTKADNEGYRVYENDNTGFYKATSVKFDRMDGDSNSYLFSLQEFSENRTIGVEFLNISGKFPGVENSFKSGHTAEGKSFFEFTVNPSITQPLDSLANELQDNMLVTKKYVDEHSSDSVVHRTGDESITGIKTFQILPQSPLDPVLDGEFVTLRYFKEHGGGIDPTAVHKIGDEIIDGVKTFTKLPRSEATPTEGSEIITKKYGDDNYVKTTHDTPQIISSQIRFDDEVTFAKRTIYVEAPTCQQSTGYKDDSLVPKSYVDSHAGENSVHRTGDETIEGIKTFLTLPQTTLTPTSPNEFATKGYVDTHSPEPTGGYLKLTSLLPQTITEEIINFNNKCNYFAHYPEYSGDEGDPSKERQFATVGYVQEYAGKKDSTGTQILSGILNWVLSQGAAYVTGKFFEGTSVAKWACDGINWLKEGVDKLAKGFGLNFIQKNMGLEEFLGGEISGPLFEDLEEANSLIEVLGNKSEGMINSLAKSKSSISTDWTVLSHSDLGNSSIHQWVESMQTPDMREVPLDVIYNEEGSHELFNPIEYGEVNRVKSSCSKRLYKDEDNKPCINLNTTYDTDTTDINLSHSAINLVYKTNNRTSVIGLHDRLITGVSNPNKPNTQARTESYIDESGFSVIKLDADTVQVTGPPDSTFKIDTAKFHFYCRPQIDTSIPISSPAHVITSGECQNLIDASMGAYIPKDLDVEVSSNKRLRLNPGIITFTSPGKLEFRNAQAEDHYTRIEADTADRLYIGCTKSIHFNTGGTITSNKPWTVINSNGKTKEGVTYEINEGTKNTGGGLILGYEEAKISFDLFKSGRPLSLILRRYQSQPSDPGKYKDCLIVQEYNGDEVIVTESGWV